MVASRIALSVRALRRTGRLAPEAFRSGFDSVAMSSLSLRDGTLRLVCVLAFAKRDGSSRSYQGGSDMHRKTQLLAAAALAALMTASLAGAAFAAGTPGAAAVKVGPSS